MSTETRALMGIGFGAGALSCAGIALAVGAFAFHAASDWVLDGGLGDSLVGLGLLGYPVFVLLGGLSALFSVAAGALVVLGVMRRRARREER